MHKRFLEYVKSLLILLLTLSAVFLLLETQTYFEATGEKLWHTLRWAMVSDVVQETEVDLKAAAVPLRIAVSNAAGRYGVQYDEAAADKLYGEVNSLLAEALGSAKEAAEVTEQAWRDALGSEGAYFDFLGAVPLRALSAWLNDSPNEQLSASVRRILVAAGDDGAVFLYYINETDGMFYACETAAILTGRLGEAFSLYLPNGAVFAFESEERYETFDPYTMLLPQRPACQVLNGANPLENKELPVEILTALEFNPYTNFTYSVSGEQVVREGTATLRSTEAGKVTYHGGSDDERMRIVSEKSVPTEVEIIEGARRLAGRTIGTFCGGARLYLIGTDWKEDGSCEVRFGYCFNGAAIQLFEHGYAASVLVSGGQVTACSLYFRHYQWSGTTVSLLPELQAAAALEELEAQGGGLLAGYLDLGEEVLDPGWILWGKGFWL